MLEPQDIVLLWTDIETPGLNVEVDPIIEIAWQLTDFLGNPLTEARSYTTIAHGDTELAMHVIKRYTECDPYVQEMHTVNGLWKDAIFPSEWGKALDIHNCIEQMLSDAEEARRVTGHSEVRLAGSTVHFDKKFIEAAHGGELPIHYRVFDLSTLRPVMHMQGIDPDSFSTHLITDAHRAADDIERDIAQWRGIVRTLAAN